MAFDVTRAVNDAIAKNKVSFNLDENFDDTQMRAFVSNLITAFFDELKNNGVVNIQLTDGSVTISGSSVTDETGLLDDLTGTGSIE